MIPELSIVIPCYNEEDNVVSICAAVHAQAEQWATSHEIVLIDNCSTDTTRPLIRQLCAADSRVRAIFNNRDYGQMRSPTHGIYQARGAAVIGMCADFQDPPAMIGPFLQAWRAGAQVVLAQRRSEQAPALLGLARRLGYALLRRLGDHPVVPGATGFGLFDRTVVDELRRWNEPEPFFRGMVVEGGFRLTVIPFDRPPRAAGHSKNGVASLLAFSLSGFASSAGTLLRAPLLIGIMATLATLVLALWTLAALVLGAPWQGPALATLAGAGFSAVMLSLGLVADQVRLLALRSRKLPLVIEEERLNWQDTA